MPMLARVFLAVAGAYWALLFFVGFGACFGSRNCDTTYIESTLWGCAAALPFVLPAVLPRQPLLTALSLIVLVAFLVWKLGTASPWNVSGLLEARAWTNWLSVAFRTIPLLFLLAAIVVYCLSLLSWLRRKVRDT